MRHITKLALLWGGASLTSLAGAQPAPAGEPGSQDSSQPAPSPEPPPAPVAEPPATPDAPPTPEASSPPATEEQGTAAALDGKGESYGPPQPTGMGAEADTAASASPFKRGGRVILGFEHVGGVYSTSETTTSADQGPSGLGPPETSEVTRSTLRISLFGSEGAGAFTAPKLALDVTLTSNVTLGGSLYFYSTTISSAGTFAGEAVSGTDRTLSGFGINPRLGVALGEKPIVWLRAGIAYASASAPDSDPTDTVNAEVSQSTTALSLEAVLVVMAGERGFGFGVGPSIYLPLSSSLEIGGAEPPSTEVSTFSWLIAASGYFAP